MMEELTGRWLMDKSQSTGIDAMLKLQQIGYILRKGVSLATVHLEIQVRPDDSENSNATVIEIDAIPTGGLPSTKEVRVTDWKEKEQNEFLFGKCVHQSQVVTGSVKKSEGGEGKGGESKAKGLYPDFEMQVTIEDEIARKFLRGEVLEDGSETEWATIEQKKTERFDAANEDAEKKDKDFWVHIFVKNVDGVGWTSEQIWGFEVINGERYYTRRVVVASPKGEYSMGRLAYKPCPKQ